MENNKCSKKKLICSLITFLIVAMLVISNYVIVDYKVKGVANNVVAKMLALEYSKVGGKENYNKLNEIQREQIIQGLKQYESQNGPIETGTKTSEEVKPSNPEVLSSDKIAEIKKGVYILGNPEAEISFVEYSDLECPFCAKFHKAGTISKVLESYEGKVNFIFKHFPLDFHPQAQMQAEAAECIGDSYGSKKFYEFIEKVFVETKSNGRSFTVDSISDLASGLGADKAKLKACLDSGKFEEKVKAQMAEGSSIGVTGTPGNVLINNETGEYKIQSGAYPFESFKTVIDGLLK